MTTYKGIEYSTANITDMREWLTDCIWQDMDSEDIYGLTDIEILQGVQRHYEGGLTNFLAINNEYDNKKVN
jgi:hypothetical protein